MSSKHPLDEIWPVLDPPAGFGERVLQALDKTPVVEAVPIPPPVGPRRPRRRASRTVWLAAGMCAGAAAGVALMSFWPSGDSKPTAPVPSGHLLADIRQTLPIGDRGLAVAERGAELAWFVVAGNPRVEQPRGSVFYRIDRGGPFTVATPVGDVRVTGTCFRVSVEPDGDERPAMVAMIEVLEGAVLLAGSRGELGLTAGEKGRMSAYAPPVRVDPDLGAATRRRPEIEARVRQLEQALSDARKAAAREDRPTVDKVYDLTPEDRRTLARRCELRYHLPRHLTGLDAPSLDESLPLPGEQREQVLQLMQEHREQYIAALQSLYTEVTGDRAIATRLAPKGLQEELFAKLAPQELKDARRRILEEWEQGLPARPPRGPAERFMRLVSGAGEAFFGQLVDLVGPERARQIRSRTTSDWLTFSPAFDCGSRPKKQ